MLQPLLISVVLSSPLQPTSGYGSTYVFNQLGPWNNPDCFEGNTINLTLEGMLEGSSDHLLCIDGQYSSQSRAETRLTITQDGFNMHVNGWGEAVGSDEIAAYSRHDIDATIDLELHADSRIRVDWFLFGAGLASVQLALQRIGDIGGPSDPSAPIIDRVVSTYIDSIMLDGIDVLFMHQGRWRIEMHSTHHAMYTKPGFMHGFARTNHAAIYVPLGDVDGSTVVDVQDVLVLLSQFGPCTEHCLGDLDGNGAVDVTDLLQVLGDYGQFN